MVSLFSWTSVILHLFVSSKMCVSHKWICWYTVRVAVPPEKWLCNWSATGCDLFLHILLTDLSLLHHVPFSAKSLGPFPWKETQGTMPWAFKFAMRHGWMHLSWQTNPQLQSIDKQNHVIVPSQTVFSLSFHVVASLRLRPTNRRHLALSQVCKAQHKTCPIFLRFTKSTKKDSQSDSIYVAFLHTQKSPSFSTHADNHLSPESEKSTRMFIELRKGLAEQENGSSKTIHRLHSFWSFQIFISPKMFLTLHKDLLWAADSWLCRNYLTLSVSGGTLYVCAFCAPTNITTLDKFSHTSKGQQLPKKGAKFASSWHMTCTATKFAVSWLALALILMCVCRGAHKKNMSKKKTRQRFFRAPPPDPMNVPRAMRDAPFV